MLQILNPNPSDGTGFARNKAESAFPEMWDGLKGLWVPFLGPSGQLMDWSGGNKHGALNGPTWIGGALRFVDGDTDYVQLSDLGNFQADLSIVVLFRLNSDNGAVNHFVGRCDSGSADMNFQFRAHMGANNYLQFVWRNAAQTAFRQLTGTVDSLTVGKWFSVVATHRFGSTSHDHLYINAEDTYVPGASDPSTDAPFVGGDQGMRIGYRNNGVHPLDGDISQVAIYDKILKQNEVIRLYENPKGLLTPRRRVTYFVPAAAGVGILRRRIEGY